MRRPDKRHGLRIVFGTHSPMPVKLPQRAEITDGVKKTTVHGKSVHVRKNVLFYKTDKMRR